MTLLQGVIGYAQYFTGLPVTLVSLHMLGVGAARRGGHRVGGRRDRARGGRRAARASSGG